MGMKPPKYTHHLASGVSLAAAHTHHRVEKIHTRLQLLHSKCCALRNFGIASVSQVDFERIPHRTLLFEGVSAVCFWKVFRKRYNLLSPFGGLCYGIAWKHPLNFLKGPPPSFEWFSFFHFFRWKKSKKTELLKSSGFFPKSSVFFTFSLNIMET